MHINYTVPSHKLILNLFAIQCYDMLLMNLINAQEYLGKPQQISQWTPDLWHVLEEITSKPKSPIHLEEQQIAWLKIRVMGLTKWSTHLLKKVNGQNKAAW